MMRPGGGGLFMCWRSGWRFLLGTIVIIVIAWHLLTAITAANETRLQSLQAKIFQYQDQIEQLINADRQRSRSLHELRQQMRILLHSEAGVNRSAISPLLAFEQSDLTMPNIYDNLPHLLTKSLTRLNPVVKLQANYSSRRDAFLVVGIPTTKRPGLTYLVTALQSMFAGLTAEERVDLLFVVLVADAGGAESDFVRETITTMQTEFRSDLDSGLLEVIAMSADWYPPDLNAIPATFGDSPERMYWRTKQNLDYIYLMLYCAGRAHYYMQLEDDVVTKPGYVSRIRAVIDENKERPWMMLEFSSLGFIGKLFRTRDLSLLAQYIAMFYREKPVDWLLDSIFGVRYCSPEKTGKHCKQLTDNHRIRVKPSLFQHIGVRSSLPGKVQKLRERDFGKPLLHIAHTDNPSAEIETSLTVYQSYGLGPAYAGRGFFWALTPKIDDVIRFKFKQPIELKGVLIRSGSVEHPGDLMPNATVVEVQRGNWDSPYEHLVDFGADGVARFDAPVSLSTVASLRVRVRENSTNWLIISEIWIKT